VIGRCPGLGDYAEEYARKFVKQEEMISGWTWLINEKEFGLAKMKRVHCNVLENVSLARVHPVYGDYKQGALGVYLNTH